MSLGALAGSDSLIGVQPADTSSSQVSSSAQVGLLGDLAQIDQGDLNVQASSLDGTSSLSQPNFQSLLENSSAMYHPTQNPDTSAQGGATTTSDPGSGQVQNKHDNQDSSSNPASLVGGGQVIFSSPTQSTTTSGPGSSQSNSPPETNQVQAPSSTGQVGSSNQTDTTTNSQATGGSTNQMGTSDQASVLNKTDQSVGGEPTLQAHSSNSPDQPVLNKTTTSVPVGGPSNKQASGVASDVQVTPLVKAQLLAPTEATLSDSKAQSTPVLPRQVVPGPTPAKVGPSLGKQVASSVSSTQTPQVDTPDPIVSVILSRPQISQPGSPSTTTVAGKTNPGQPATTVRPVPLGVQGESQSNPGQAQGKSGGAELANNPPVSVSDKSTTQATPQLAQPGLKSSIENVQANQGNSGQSGSGSQPVSGQTKVAGGQQGSPGEFTRAISTPASQVKAGNPGPNQSGVQLQATQVSSQSRVDLNSDQVSSQGTTQSVVLTPTGGSARQDSGVKPDLSSASNGQLVSQASAGSPTQPVVGQDFVGILAGATASIAPGMSNLQPTGVIQAGPAMADQLVSVLTPMTSGPAGTHSIVLQLQPDGLGLIRASVVTSPGSVTIHITAQTEAGYEALNSTLDNLQSSLSSFAGFGASVTVSHQDNPDNLSGSKKGTQNGPDALGVASVEEPDQVVSVSTTHNNVDIEL